MTDEIDVYVASLAAHENAAHSSNLIDQHLSLAKTTGDMVMITLTKGEAKTLQYFACEAACSARRLHEALEAQLDAEIAQGDQLKAETDALFEEAADALNSLPDELLRVPANDPN